MRTNFLKKILITLAISTCILNTTKMYWWWEFDVWLLNPDILNLVNNWDFEWAAQLLEYNNDNFINGDVRFTNFNANVSQDANWNIIITTNSDFFWPDTTVFTVNQWSNQNNQPEPTPRSEPPVSNPTPTPTPETTPTPTPEPITPPVTPPPPPPPVVTTSSTYWWACSSYIHHWNPIWSVCTINSNWTTVWKITCIQTKDWVPVSASCWTIVTETTETCNWEDCSTSSYSYCDTSSCSPDTPKPAILSQNIDVTMTLSSPTPNPTNSNAYANNSDANSFRVNISWTTNQNRDIVWWWTNWSFSDFQDNSSQYADRIGSSGNKALNFSDVPTSNISWAWTNFTFQVNNIKSVSPFVWNWNINFKAWWTSLTLSNVHYTYKKPFVWYIETWDYANVNWNWKPRIWTVDKYRIWLTSKSNLTWAWLSAYKLDDFSSKIEPINSNLDIQSKNIDTSTLNKTTWTIFYSRINTSTSNLSSLPTPWLKIELPIVSYSLWWKTVKYKLSKNDAWDDLTPIDKTWTSFDWVKIVGNLQWKWKQSITWQKSNFTDLSASEQRANIKKNVYNLIKWMKNGQVLNWLKLHEWDISLSWVLSYETIVVKNWNVKIDWDLNATWKKLWIIVIRDNQTIEDIWNIYVIPNVTSINAIIYADWGFISTWFKSWEDIVSNYRDSETRTSKLINQLIFKWSLFTRNTIWWAILAWWKYILPWWSKTDNFDKAMMYDLNYIRRNNIWNSTYNEPFVILYNASLINDPPIGFR